MSDSPEVTTRTECERRAREHTIAGGALGAASLGSLAVFGTVACPLCIVAAPALVCSGIWNARKARREKEGSCDDGTDGSVQPICTE